MTTVKKPVIRSRYNYNRNEVSRLTNSHCQGESRTQQHFKDECDINNILRKFNVTGLLPRSPLSPRYGDFSGIGDYQSCLNAVLRSQDEFDALPAHIRARFDNDPAKLIDFVDDEANRAEAIDLGLIVSPQAPPVDLTGSKIEPPTPPAES